jgi:hypothetical protein
LQLFILLNDVNDDDDDDDDVDDDDDDDGASSSSLPLSILLNNVHDDDDDDDDEDASFSSSPSADDDDNSSYSPPADSDDEDDEDDDDDASSSSFHSADHTTLDLLQLRQTHVPVFAAKQRHDQGRGYREEGGLQSIQGLRRVDQGIGSKDWYRRRRHVQVRPSGHEGRRERSEGLSTTRLV